MKKRIFALFLMLLLVSSLSVPAFAAESYDAEYTWDVVFTANGQALDTANVVVIKDGQVINDYKIGKDAIIFALGSMQPGDRIKMTANVYNRYSKSVDFYMWNIINAIMESAQVAHGGGYTYTLTYTNPSGTRQTIYNSERVGGQNASNNSDVVLGGREGLEIATASLEDYFFLDTLSPSATRHGTVELVVALDGESQGNDYQNTDGELSLRFAVEVPQSNSRTTVVKTGDEYNLSPFYIAMVVSGLVFLYLALDAYTDRLYGRKG